jgi:hypothetical protein
MNNLKSNMSQHLYLTTFILGLSVLSFQACVNPPDYPTEPVLTFKNFSKNGMKQNPSKGADYIDVVLGFTDGDGDLGNVEDGAKEDVFVFDTRDQVVSDNFKVPYVAPQGTGNGINGEMTLRVYTTCCKYPDGSLPCFPSATYKTDTLRYKVWIFDRAGHKSNELELPAIYLDCTK